MDATFHRGCVSRWKRNRPYSILYRPPCPTRSPVSTLCPVATKLWTGYYSTGESNKRPLPDSNSCVARIRWNDGNVCRSSPSWPLASAIAKTVRVRKIFSSHLRGASGSRTAGDCGNSRYPEFSKQRTCIRNGGYTRVAAQVPIQAHTATFLAFCLGLPLPRNSTFFSSRSLSLPRSIIVYANRHTAAG